MWDKVKKFMTTVDRGIDVYTSTMDNVEAKFMKKVCKTDKTIDQVLDVGLGKTINLFNSAKQKVSEYRSGSPQPKEEI